MRRKSNTAAVAMTTTGEPMDTVVIDWIKSNKAICWGIFWIGWFYISPTTIIPGAIAVGVGNVFYKERALNLVTVCAAWLGIFAYLALAGALKALPEQVNLWMGFAVIFALIVLGKRFPMFGYFLIIMICSALFRGGVGRYRRRW